MWVRALRFPSEFCVKIDFASNWLQYAFVYKFFIKSYENMFTINMSNGVNRLQDQLNSSTASRRQCRKILNAEIIHSQLDAFSVFASFFTNKKSNIPHSVVCVCLRQRQTNRHEKFLCKFFIRRVRFMLPSSHHFGTRTNWFSKK